MPLRLECASESDPVAVDSCKQTRNPRDMRRTRHVVNPIGSACPAPITLGSHHVQEAFIGDVGSQTSACIALQLQRMAFISPSGPYSRLGHNFPLPCVDTVGRAHHPPSLTPLFISLGNTGLPTPQIGTFSVSGGPQISEKKILGDTKTLSETIGYRIVGTKEHARGDDWGVMKVKELKRTCDSVIARAKEEKRNIRLECEWDRQQGSGTHR